MNYIKEWEGLKDYINEQVKYWKQIQKQGAEGSVVNLKAQGRIEGLKMVLSQMEAVEEWYKEESR